MTFSRSEGDKESLILDGDGYDETQYVAGGAWRLFWPSAFKSVKKNKKKTV